MHKILLISLLNENNLIESSRSISKLHQDNPLSEIHILTFSHQEKLARMISNTVKVHLIDKMRIKQILNSKLYHDGFAINIFNQNLSEIIDTQWSLVINHSNDAISSYLVSALNASRIIGTRVTVRCINENKKLPNQNI